MYYSTWWIMSLSASHDYHTLYGIENHTVCDHIKQVQILYMQWYSIHPQ